MENPTKEIIEKIKKDHIVMESHFKLNWKNYLFWIFLVSMISLGALFFSFIVINLLDIRLEIFRYLGVGKFFFLLLATAPYLWVGLFLVALTSGYIAFRKTKRGYRYSIISITSAGVLIISLFGVVIHMTGVNTMIGRGMGAQGKLAFPIQERWSHPKEKLLGGEIVAMYPDNFMLVNFMDEIWEVAYSPETTIIEVGELKVGMKVGIVGEVVGENRFKSELIRKLPPRMFFDGEDDTRPRKFKNRIIN
jgi:hypothetical protein